MKDDKKTISRSDYMRRGIRNRRVAPHIVRRFLRSQVSLILLEREGQSPSSRLTTI